MLPFLLTVLAVYVLLLVIRFASVFYGVWSGAFAAVRFAVDEEFPEELKPTFNGIIAEYAALGFSPVHYLAIYNIEGVRNASILLENRAAASFSTLSLSTIPEAHNPFVAVFYTFLDDGKLLATFNGVAHLVVGEIPATILQDGYAASLQDQWQLHEGTLRKFAPEFRPQQLAWQDFIHMLAAHYDAYVESLFAAKQAVRGKEQGEFYLTARAAWRLALGALAGGRKRAAMQKKLLARHKADQAPPLPLPVSYEVESFLSFDQRKQRPVPVGTRLTGLAISLVLFTLSFSLLLDMQTVLALIGVLAVHELGHLAAMKLVGYQNFSYLFLPFLGAAVSGKKEDATLAETMLVLFAGPLPGMLIGVALAFTLAFTGVGFPRQLLIWLSLLIFLNYINLLPLYPLDGGRIVDRLLFAHNPSAGAWFKAFAAGVFLFSWLFMQDFVLLALGIILFLSMRANFRQAKAINGVSKHLPAEMPDGEREALTAIYNALEPAGQAAESFQNKYLLVKAIRARRFASGDRLFARLGLLGFYLACLLGGPLLWFWLVLLVRG